MPGTTYQVAVEIQQKGGLGGGGGGGLDEKFSRMAGSAGRLDSALYRVGHSLNSLGGKLMAPFDAVVGKMAEATASIAKFGGAAAFGAITYGATKLNSELEKTTISLAAMIKANDKAETMGDAIGLSAKLMRDMRKDAAALPGTFEDLANITRTVMIPGLHAGMDLTQLRKFAQRTMAAGVTAGLDPGMIGREMAMMLEGRGGARNVLEQRILGKSGNAAKKFNQLGMDDRLKEINVALSKFDPAIEQFSHSYTALSTTLITNAKMFLATATLPLFEKIKSTIGQMNNWYDSNKKMVDSYAENLGAKLASAFDWGKAKILEWYPAIEAFAINAYDKVMGFWEGNKSSIESIGSSIQEFLKAPDSIDKIIHALELYLLAKGSGQVVSMGLSLAQVGVGMRTMSLLSKGAAGAGAAAAGSGAVEAAAGAAAAGASVGVAAALGAIAAVATVGVVAGVSAMEQVNAQSGKGTKIDRMWKDAQEQWTIAGQDWKYTMDQMAIAVKPATDGIASLYNALGEGFVAACSGAASAISTVTGALAQASRWLNHGGGDSGDELPPGEKAKVSSAMNIARIANRPVWHGDDWRKVGDPALEKASKKYKSEHPGGGGGTSIQKVEIVVTSNQDPSRIARQVFDVMQGIQRNPKVSRHVRPVSMSIKD